MRRRRLPPDDKREESEVDAARAPDPQQAATGDGGDDLESLAGALPHPSEAPPDADGSELGALAGMTKGEARDGGGAPASGAASDDDGLLDLGQLVASARRSLPPAAESDAVTVAKLEGTGGSLGLPLALSSSVGMAPGLVSAPPRSRAAWVMPLLVGLGLGVGIAGTLFGLSASRAPTSSSEPARAPVAAAPEAPTATAQAPASAAVAPSAAASTLGSKAPAPSAVAAEARPTEPGPAPRGLGAAAPVRKALPLASASPPSPAVSPPAPSAPAVAAAAPPVAAVALPEPDETTAKVAPESASAKAAAPHSVDALLDEALAPAARQQVMQQQRAAALEQTQLPLAPSRDDVTQAMTVLLPAIRGCAMGQRGLATAGIVVRADGRVAGVDVAGAPFAGTPSGRCMEGVIRRAHFPRFKQPTFRIKFPFAIQ
jgi:hypothetical protein